MAGSQTLLTVSIPTLAVLIGILVNNSRLNDMDARFSAMGSYMDARFDAVDRRFSEMETLFTENAARGAGHGRPPQAPGGKPVAQRVSAPGPSRRRVVCC
jgi:hypothetical protein